MAFAVDTTPEYVAGQFPPFAVTVDLVVLTVRDGALCALLIQRGEQPHLGRSALPGGFVRLDEDLDVAARRELSEETGLTPLPVHLEQLATYGAVGRDPRMRVVSVAYLALAPDLPSPQAGGDAAAAAWVPVGRVLPDLFLAQQSVSQHSSSPVSSSRVSSSPVSSSQSFASPAGAADRTALAFDHVGILADGVERARAKLEYSPLAAAFCPAEFTVGELRRVYEAVWGVPLDARNFHRKVTGTAGFLLPVGRATVRQGGRPAQLFRRGPATLLNPPMLRPS
jgi:8-oxo-dGTP diphosphatase